MSSTDQAVAKWTRNGRAKKNFSPDYLSCLLFFSTSTPSFVLLFFLQRRLLTMERPLPRLPELLLHSKFFPTSSPGLMKNKAGRREQPVRPFYFWCLSDLLACPRLIRVFSDVSCCFDHFAPPTRKHKYCRSASLTNMHPRSLTFPHDASHSLHPSRRPCLPSTIFLPITIPSPPIRSP